MSKPRRIVSTRRLAYLGQRSKARARVRDPHERVGITWVLWLSVGGLNTPMGTRHDRRVRGLRGRVRAGLRASLGRRPLGRTS